MISQLLEENYQDESGSFTLIKNPYHEQNNFLDFWSSTECFIGNNNISDFPIT